jgi:adenosylmethionine-8-amino-7-oxononanoate aminotransferase
MAFQYWRLKAGSSRGARGAGHKNTFLKLRNAYHGDTLGSVSVGGIKLFHDSFHPLLIKTFSADAPYRYRDAFKGTDGEYARYCADKVEAVLKRHHERIAALVVEPLMQGAAGMLDQPPGYLSRLRALTRRYEVLLIADEVATGFGRTGKMFACEHEGVTPDFLCLAKNITGGYLPLSATLTTGSVYRTFLAEYAEFKAFFHGHTYSASPLACAAALANLGLFRKKRVIERLRPKALALGRHLDAMRAHPHVGDVRQKGFMAGIELVADKRTRRPYPLEEKRGIRVGLEARKRGVMIRPLGNVIVLMPPLTIRGGELDRLCRVVHECIDRVTR